jgi:diaminohydroxyphosphoribosylaminopyrimidine deaminase/5-amino-6-(5-phosphoribosylamino)uracil reductase
MMRRALGLAALGRGTVNPNPLVGAVVVGGGEIVGQGYHRRAGEAHAEILALAEAGPRARGGTLYTNLEPCCHVGRTPPCVEEIVRAGVARVVAAMQDPNPRVNGGGFRALRRRGISVEAGLLHAEAVGLNQPFIKFVRQRVPYVTLKAGVSLDGRIATRTGRSKWITSSESRKHARLLRLESDAVMVGIETVLRDDPRLTPRLPRARPSPLLRVIVDSRLRLPPGSRLVKSKTRAPILVFTSRRAPTRRISRLRRLGVEVERLPLRGGGVDLSRALVRLGERSVSQLLVEGGGELHASFLEQHLADRLVLYLAPRLIGGGRARPLIGGVGPADPAKASRVQVRNWARVGEEIRIEGDLKEWR